MKTALITGNRGFIGLHLGIALKRMGVEVIGFDLKDGFDIRQQRPYPEADWCFHLAAITDARSEDTDLIMKTNVVGTLRVLQQFRDRVTFTSSSAVNYPETPYAISKVIGEQLCKHYEARIVRLCNIHGEMGHGVIDKFHRQSVLEVAGLGDQIRTYAPVADAVAALLDAPTRPKGSLVILPGEDMTVNEIVLKYFPDRIYKRVPRSPNDIQDGRQICP